MNASTRLFEADRHEPIADVIWDRVRAQGEIERIGKSVAAARMTNGFWPDNEDMAASLYGGAAGIIWTARELTDRGYKIEQSCLERPEVIDGVGLWEKYGTLFAEARVPVSQSFLMGPVGVLMLQEKLERDETLLDRLDNLITSNQTHPWMENLWGAPSTMGAASHLYEATGEERFANHIRNGAAYMWDRLENSQEAACQLWNISLYGGQFKFLGAGHGFVGNVFPVIRHLQLFDAADQKKWIDLVVRTVGATALVQNGLANWPPVMDKAADVPDKIQVHQCHGAPGFVIGLMSLFGAGHSQFDDLLLAAGELIWQAGPLKKYPCLCHGTPGNGYAFLKLWTATGDTKWLTRAHAFAMTAIAQRDKWIEAGGQSENSLWEGDMGLAIYLADCIEGKSDFPTLDYF